MSVESFKSKRYIYFCAAFIATFCAGLGYAWSVIQAALLAQHPDWSVSAVVITYTLQVTFSCLTPSFFGSIIKKFNTKQNILIGAVLYGCGLIICSFASNLVMLYIGWGIIAGIGVGWIYPIMMSYALRVLPDKGSLASGLMAAAYGSGAVVWAPVTNALVNATSINMAFIILGVVFLVVIALASFILVDVPEEYVLMYSVPKGESGAPRKKVKDMTRGQMAKTATFYIMVVCFSLALTSGMLVISQSKSIITYTGGNLAATAALCVSIVSIFNTVGRIAWGALANKITTYNACIVLFVLATIAMGALAFIPAGSGVAIVVFMCLTASCYGGFATMITPMTADMFGTKFLTENFGLMYIVYAFSSLIGPQLAAQLTTTDAAGTITSYSMAYLVGCVLSIIGIVSAILVKSRLKYVEYEDVQI